MPDQMVGANLLRLYIYWMLLVVFISFPNGMGRLKLHLTRGWLHSLIVSVEQIKRRKHDLPNVRLCSKLALMLIKILRVPIFIPLAHPFIC